MRGSVWAALLLGAIACGGNDQLPPPAEIAAVASSNGQTGPAGARLAQPLEVLVSAADGSPVARAEVRWTVTGGSGATVSDSVTLSDGTGQAQVALTLGTTPGEYRVLAELKAVTGKAVTLTATAAAPPVLTGVNPTTFTGGDTVVLTGQRLGTSTAVLMAGQPARVLTATATGATTIAPVCLVPGPVQVQARVGPAVSNALTATFQASSAPLALQPGDYASIDPAALAGCATFPDAGPAGAEYLLAPQSVTGTPGDSQAYVFQGDSTPTTPIPARLHATTPIPAAVAFHDHLREEEAAMARRPHPPLVTGALLAAPVVQRVQVGDQRTFRVCKVVTCQADSDFATVTATAEAVGTHAAIFQDVTAPAGGFTSADFDSLRVLFDEHLYEIDTKAFGVESDVDQNGVVIILFTPTVNALTPKNQCSTSIITGFFYGLDIDPNFATDPRSNHGEIFYAMAPDPTGTVTCTISTDLVRRLVPVTFIHEFQHMISYNQHVLVRGKSAEVLWLNEAMSHLAEELGGLHFEGLGRTDLFSNFTLGDLYNGYLYLSDPGEIFTFPSAGTGTLEERGAGWLYLRWLVDHFGSDLTRRLEETGLTGWANVEAATGEPTSRLVAQWFLANYVSDLPGFQAPPRLRYSTWAFRTTYASLHQQLPSRFDRSFPLVPTQLLTRTFAVSGMLHAGSGDYYRIVQDSAGRGFAVQLTAPGGGPLPTGALARLDVLRIR